MPLIAAAAARRSERGRFGVESARRVGDRLAAKAGKPCENRSFRKSREASMFEPRPESLGARLVFSRAIARYSTRWGAVRNKMFMSTAVETPATDPPLEYCQTEKSNCAVGAATSYWASHTGREPMSEGR